MAYALQQDLIDRFGEAELLQLTDPMGELGAIDAARVATALADADRLIDGYCGGRYLLPLTPVPDLVVRIACDIARYHLHSGPGANPLDVVKDNHRDAVRQLEAISAGRLTLSVAGISTTEAAGDSTVRVDAPGRRLAGNLGGF